MEGDDLVLLAVAHQDRGRVVGERLDLLLGDGLAQQEVAAEREDAGELDVGREASVEAHGRT